MSPLDTGNPSSTADTPYRVMRLFFDLLPSGRCLNVGSGSTGALGARLDQDVVCCDIAAARSIHRYLRGDVQALPFASASFDGILAKDVLEHVDDVMGALAELHRVARSGCRLVVNTPRAVPRAVWADVTHRRGFTGAALDGALAASGWSLSSRRRIGPVPGAGRLGLERHLTTILRVPGIGHRYGTNWIAVAVRK